MRVFVKLVLVSALRIGQAGRLRIGQAGADSSSKGLRGSKVALERGGTDVFKEKAELAPPVVEAEAVKEPASALQEAEVVLAKIKETTKEAAGALPALEAAEVLPAMEAANWSLTLVAKRCADGHSWQPQWMVGILTQQACQRHCGPKCGGIYYVEREPDPKRDNPYSQNCYFCAGPLPSPLPLGLFKTAYNGFNFYQKPDAVIEEERAAQARKEKVEANRKAAEEVMHVEAILMIAGKALEAKTLAKTTSAEKIQARARARARARAERMKAATCKRGRIAWQSSGHLFETNDNSWEKCKAQCDRRPKCVVFDYTDTPQKDACRVAEAEAGETPRSSRFLNPHNRNFCTKSQDKNNTPAVGNAD